jgi:hypothetical protein
MKRFCAAIPVISSIIILFLLNGCMLESQTLTVPSNSTSVNLNTTVVSSGYQTNTTDQTDLNHPIIDSLTADPSTIVFETFSTITCMAHDPHGQRLTYSWEASQGQLSGAGHTVTLKIPGVTLENTSVVKVVVTNDTGLTAAMSVDVIVPVRPGLIIKSLTASPTSLKAGGVSTIYCDAATPGAGELQYSWKASGGTITGEGNTVTFTAPSDCQTVTITVTVVDENDFSVSHDLIITVAKEGG